MADRNEADALFATKRKKQQEETIQREQVVEQVERYEESMQERPNPKTRQSRNEGKK